MAVKRFICPANSRKYGQRCAAGIYGLIPPGKDNETKSRNPDCINLRSISEPDRQVVVSRNKRDEKVSYIQQNLPSGCCHPYSVSGAGRGYPALQSV